MMDLMCLKLNSIYILIKIQKILLQYFRLPIKDSLNNILKEI